MKVAYNNGRVSDIGFVYVASKNRIYYEMALASIETMRDHHPDAHVTLFTHEKFIDKRCEQFDNVVVGIPIHKRARIWCMANTPYQSTVSIDSDSIITHRDVKKIHSHYLTQYDMVFGTNVSYTVGDIKWAFIDKARTIHARYHGGVFGFNKMDLTIDFMSTWYDEYIKQTTTPWTYKNSHPEWQQFDMFTIWRLTSGEFAEFDRFKDLKIDNVPRRFNSSWQDLPADLDGPRAITLVDYMTWSRVSNRWPQMIREAKNEKHQVEQQQASDTIIKYN